MISVEEALGILLSNLPERKVERIAFQSLVVAQKKFDLF